MTPERLRRLDTDRAALEMSRGGALAAIYDAFGRDLVAELQRNSAEASAQGQRLEAWSDELVESIDALAAAWTERARQRQHIGVHSNQIAKLANALRIQLRNGEPFTEDEIDRLIYALAEVDYRLAQLVEAERTEDELISRLRNVLQFVSRYGR